MPCSFTLELIRGCTWVAGYGDVPNDRSNCICTTDSVHWTLGPALHRARSRRVSSRSATAAGRSKACLPVVAKRQQGFAEKWSGNLIRTDWQSRRNWPEPLRARSEPEFSASTRRNHSPLLKPDRRQAQHPPSPYVTENSHSCSTPDG